MNWKPVNTLPNWNGAAALLSPLRPLSQPTPCAWPLLLPFMAAADVLLLATLATPFEEAAAAAAVPLW